MRTTNVIRHGRIEITEFQCTPTPLGNFYWDPSKLNLAILAGFLGANAGFMAGSTVGTLTGSSLLAAVFALLGLVLASAASVATTVRA